ncbi:MAG: restriction endonuclease subunit S, partial [Bacteroidales bacterium]|nr:restriction endonuclease subunit S [Bacteroidales bacterium]
IHNQILDNSNCDYISYEKYEESPEIKVYNGDILFCKTASIGKCAIVKGLIEKATINPQFVVLKDFKCNNVFLYYILAFSSFQDRVLAITGGSTIPTMSQEKLKEQLIYLPSSSEQEAIASVLTSLDDEIISLETKKAKYESIKQGMMQQLLTGKIRFI